MSEHGTDPSIFWGDEEPDEPGAVDAADEAAEAASESALTPDAIEEEERYLEAVLAGQKKLDPVARLIEQFKKRDAMTLLIPPPEKGQGRQIRGTIDVHVGLFIQRLIASKRWPWKDENSFVRSAIAYMIRCARLDQDSEYSDYFRTYWEMCRRARLIQRLEDVGVLVAHVERAVRAYLLLGKSDEAVEYLTSELKVLRAEENGFNRAAMEAIERAMQEGGPATRAVWARAR